MMRPGVLFLGLWGWFCQLMSGVQAWRAERLSKASKEWNRRMEAAFNRRQDQRWAPE